MLQTIHTQGKLVELFVTLLHLRGLSDYLNSIRLLHYPSVLCITMLMEIIETRNILRLLYES